ncbi:tyrosine-type recombinase/integrase [Halopenitus persicus]|uniref:Phage integrase family protein n=1 Tax=Halopenitus persicus TaxID=1048396 RepID=A0A1H3KM89_9EURY|nr:site-specific integrase [Halopenitus persicus]SDY52838.1 Phage integrase family protein [Halopenitus persicus]
MADVRKQIETLRERIETSNEIDQRDKEILIRFSDKIDLLKSEYTDHRHNKLLRHCTILAENVGGIASALEDRDAAEDLVRWINRNYDNEYTNHDYRTAIRVLARRVTEGDDLPTSVEWIPSGMSNSHDPVPDPGDMLRWEDDILPMIEETRNSRDAALIAVAFDSGARSGELRNLTIGNVSDHEHGLSIHVDGKTGQRSVTLVPSVPYLQRWLNDHPDSDDPKSPLWSKLTEAEELSYRQFNNCFSDAAERADVKKPVTPTNFRKSNATYLARQGMNQAFIEDRQGRKRGSDATAHYVARFGGDADNEYAKMHGLEVEEDESEPLGPVECPRCQKDTPRHRETCVWCNQPLEYGAIESIEEDQSEVRDQVFRLAQENPEFLEDIQRARNFSEIVDDNPDILEDAQAFAESLSEE